MANLPQQHVNLNWSIDTAAKTTVAIAGGILHSATTDNVQVLALAACESYGATLAMCPITCMKMEKLAKRRFVSHVIEHLAVVIGYSAGDSADQLASSEAGCEQVHSWLANDPCLRLI